MTEPGVPRYILLSADSRGTRLVEGDEAPVVGVVQPGHGVRRVESTALIEGVDGRLQPCDAALASGVMQLSHAGDAGLMRFLFQTWMRDHVWRKLVRALARRGENVRRYKLTVVDDTLVLSRSGGDVVARHTAPDWWLIVDPDRAAEISAALLDHIELRNAA